MIVENILTHLKLEGALAIIIHDEAYSYCDDSEEATDI
jgi:hypothetical protein